MGTPEAQEKNSETQDTLSAEEKDVYSRQIAAFGLKMMTRLKVIDVGVYCVDWGK